MRHSELTGTHESVGRSWGAELAREGWFLLEKVPFAISGEQRTFARACRPVYETYFPRLLEELRGLARGQGCPAEELEAIVFSMYAVSPGCQCSCFAVSNEKGTLLGRNSDFWAELADRNLHVRYRFSDGGHAFTGNTTAFLEMEDGVNEKGLAVGLTAVAGREARPGLNAGMLVRYCLENCATVAQAVAALKKLPIASAQTITLADAGGHVALVECAPQRVEVYAPEKEGAVWAVNRFSLAGMGAYQAEGVDDWRSAQRAVTLQSVLEGEWPDFTIPMAQNLLAGRRGFLCQYAPESGKDTVWSVVYDLTGRRMYLTEGNPGRV